MAGNGAEGLDALAAGDFELVVSDIEMPVLNGLDFAKRVRDDARHADLPLLALTTLDNPEVRAKAKAAGFDGFEPKLDRDSLIAHVRQLLDQRRAMRPGEASR